MTSNVKFMNYYPFEDIETISPRPMLFIAGENAHSREFSEDTYQLAAEPKELIIIPGAGHVDLYDRTNLIRFDKLTSFSRTACGRTDTGSASSLPGIPVDRRRRMIGALTAF